MRIFMSLDYHVYLGPYIVCQPTFREQKTTWQACANPACSLHTRPATRAVNLCSMCGQALVEYSKTVDTESGERDKAEKVLDDALRAGPGHVRRHIWLPNQRRGMESFWHIDPRCETVILNLSHHKDLMVEQMHWLGEFYAAEMDKLWEIYGLESVQIEWGFLCWGS
jgi:hypothetical protein